MDSSILRYTERGDGQAVVFIHGFPFDRRIWKEQIETLGSVARVFTPDLPGFGESALTPRSVEPTISAYADAIATWAGEIGLSKLALVGHSMGGYVALQFAQQYPQMLSGLALVNTRSGPDTKAAKENRYTLAEDVRVRGAMAVVIAMLTKLFSSGTVGRDPGLADRVREIMMAQSNEAIITALRAMAARRGRLTALSALKVPTLILAGTDDAVIPVSESELMHKRARGSQYVLIGGAGHMPMMEAPDEFNQAMRDFIATL